MDEASTESSPAALPLLLAGLHGSLDYPVAVDRYGQLADGYGVQDQPWVELVSSSGKILFRHEGWFPQPSLTNAVRKRSACRGLDRPAAPGGVAGGSACRESRPRSDRVDDRCPPGARTTGVPT